MKAFFDVLLDSLIDSLKILPILLAIYLLIEFLEFKNTNRLEKMHLLNKKSSPIFGSLLGSLPQCGFSVIATDLYTKREINVGALIAVYIATSDEAIPIMLSNSKSLKVLLPLILIKIVVAIGIGYLSQSIFDKIFNKQKAIIATNKIQKEQHSFENVNKIENTNNEENVEEIHKGCCKHDIEHKKYDWKHPLLHCLKIFVTILIINLIFGCIIEFGFKGEEKLTSFLTQSSVYALQPVLAMLIGLIPNCASSVVLTELYLVGGLSFGAILAGLIVNAGLGLILLIKQNRNVKENIFIILFLILTGLVVGYGLHFLI